MTKKELMNELSELRIRISQVETLEAERRKAEQALIESEEKYRSLVESTDDSIYLVDGDCRYLFMNKKHLSRLGLPEKKVLGRTYREFHSPEETTWFIEKIDEVFQTGESVQHVHKSLRDRRYFLRTLSPVKDREGKISAVTVISKNITGLKQMEEEKERLIAELREALDKIRTLRGLIPICAWCKKIRDDKGYWKKVEEYIEEHSEALFTHGICPQCIKKSNPDLYAEMIKNPELRDILREDAD